MNDTDQAAPARSRTRLVKWFVLGIAVLVALVYGAIFVYANVLNDSPDALDEGDLGAALVDESSPDVAATVTSVVGSVVDEPMAAPGVTTPGAEGFDGNWVAVDSSAFGYRVDEVLAGVNVTAVGRSNEIDATLSIDGTTATAVDVEVQVDSIVSDDSRRDGQFRGRIMNTAEFPTATFTITEPIEFGSIPDGDATVTATATGELTLRGVTNPVTFDVTAQTTDGRIGVLGSIPVVFADYGIDNPSNGIVTTEDHGLVEFILVFDRQ